MRKSEMKSCLLFGALAGAVFAGSGVQCDRPVESDGDTRSRTSGDANPDAQADVDASMDESDTRDEASDSGRDSGATPSADSGGGYEALYRVRARGGWVICPRTPHTGTGIEDGSFVCVDGGPTGHRADPSSQYLCELERGEHPPMVGTCEERPGDVEAWNPPCDEPQGHESMERGWGKQCWAPPENICTWGCSKSNETGVRTWSCKPDASQCCRSKCQTCGRCDWIQVRGESECLLAGADSQKPESFCRQFFEKLPATYKKCIRGNCSESEEQMLIQKEPCGEEVPNESLVWCPE